MSASFRKGPSCSVTADCRGGPIRDIRDAYSITLSARANSDSGTVTPIALAVLRLITKLELGWLLDWHVGYLSALKQLDELSGQRLSTELH